MWPHGHLQLSFCSLWLATAIRAIAVCGRVAGQAQDDHEPKLGLVVSANGFDIASLGGSNRLKAQEHFAGRAAGHVVLETIVTELMRPAGFMDGLFAQANAVFTAKNGL